MTRPNKTRIVRCPGCGGPSEYDPGNESRPFCSERCKNHDFGAWASESYRVGEAGEPPPDDAVGDRPPSPLMRNVRRFLAPVLATALAACSSTAFAPRPVPPTGTPYAGLDESSYGPRTTSQFRFCDPQDGAAGSVNAPAAAPSRLGAAAQAVTAAAAAPVQGLMKIDARLQGLDLAGQFRDPVGSTFPPVAVLSHAKDSIVFWHVASAVSVQDVSKAAQAYCGQSRRAVLYRGSSTHCPAAERGLTGAAVVNTYAISAYACTARP